MSNKRMPVSINSIVRGICEIVLTLVKSPFKNISKMRVRKNPKKNNAVDTNRNEFLNTAEKSKRQGVLLQAVNNAAAVLLAADEKNFTSSLHKGMEFMAQCMDVDRIYIWRNKVKNESVQYVQEFEWLNSTGQRGKIVKPKESYSYEETFPRWREVFLKGECVNSPLSGLPQSEQERLKPFGIKSILVIPVYFHENFWGFISFDDCVNERSFEDDEVSILRSGSLMIASAMVRSEMSRDLHNAVSKMEAVISNYTGIIWSVDKNNVVTLFNGIYLKKMGIPSLVGKSLDDACKNPMYLDIIDHIEKTFEEGSQKWITELDDKMFRSYSAPIYDADGNPDGVVGSTEDITETINLQKDLESAVLEAQSASLAKSNFLSNMSHEMRTPMNAIIGMTSIGKSASNIEKKDYAFGKIENASSHLLGVINDILDMSKIEANKFELSLTEFNFEKMLQKAVNVIVFRADEKHQRFTVYIDKHIPPFLIGDDQRLTQVIANLLSNAVKFTPEYGSIRLDARLIHEENGLCTVKIEVTDTGIGISPEQQSRLFTSFEQAENSTSRKFGGTGLGLAISKSIVELMGGKIWIKSEVAKGATFAFTIEAKRSEKTESSLLNPGVNWKNIRILAVDDNPEMREYFTNIAEQFKVSCDTADGSKKAIELIESNNAYDMYFIDWNMPGMDGIELSRKIREYGADKSVIVMISASEWNGIEQRAKSAGVNSFLAKPLFPSDIVDCINSCIGLENPVFDADSALYMTDLFKGRRILLAEDVEINCEIVVSMLEDTGIEIECAKNGIDAVQMFSAAPERYDIIFMDVQMPEMDGMEATQKIRSLETPKASSIPIVAMTANVFREDIEKCIASGMNGHIGKPVDVEEVFEKLRIYLT